jgi:hypothetical protein
VTAGTVVVVARELVGLDFGDDEEQAAAIMATARPAALHRATARPAIAAP